MSSTPSVEVSGLLARNGESENYRLPTRPVSCPQGGDDEQVIAGIGVVTS
jgi:hypothetical protein